MLRYDKTRAFTNDVKYYFTARMGESVGRRNEPSELLERSSDVEACPVSCGKLDFSWVPLHFLSTSRSSRSEVGGQGSTMDDMPFGTSDFSSDHRRSLSGCIWGPLAVGESSEALVVWLEAG